MSLTDPLLKSVKFLIQEFHSIGEAVMDESVYLEQFCATLEQCFLKGMKQGQWNVGQDKQHSKQRQKFWKILLSFETDGPMPFVTTQAITEASQHKRVKTKDGKFRYFIRYCLVHRSLHALVEFLKSKRRALQQWYYEDQSSGKQAMTTMAQFGGGSTILLHEELSEQFRSLLLTCATSLSFNLNLENSFFLDETWKTPVCITTEFVPTRELGIELIYIHGYGIITKLKVGSVAADATDLSVGDLLVEMNDKVLFPATFGGDNDARSVWRYCRKHSLPCKLTVIKPRSPITGGIYTPLKSILQEYHRWMELFHKKQQQKLEDKEFKEESKQETLLSPSKDKEQAPILDPMAAEEGACGTYKVKYIGEVFTGDDGGVTQIDKVIHRVVHRCSETTTLNVILTLTQIAVETKLLDDPQSTSSLFTHKYADISSCGKIVSDELRFCYIAGDTFCTLSKQFKGYVFEAQSSCQAKTILNGIYQGFKRTTWFM